MHSTKMTFLERKAVVSLSAIMSLRMIGLFMVVPSFALYAHGLIGATPTLIGLAIGIYGLSQAICQLPFGVLSDRFGRKPIIFIGLLLFASGSLLAFFAHTITLMIIGRTLQGTGAIGATILATMADLTREENRTKSMAIAGISIGLSFSIAMIVGPILTKWLPVNGLFLIAFLLSFVAIALLFLMVPTPKRTIWHRDTEPEFHSFFSLLISPQLARLNIGILVLHAIFTASFVAIPIHLARLLDFPANKQWEIYLPSLIFAFILSIFCIGMAERKHKVKTYFLTGIFLLILAELSLAALPHHYFTTLIGLTLFLTGFTLLEAFLPSLVSRTAPVARKGSAMGIYSCAQFLGIFIGGLLGGWIYGQFSLSFVYLFSATLAIFWFSIALSMQPPRYLVTQVLKLAPNDKQFGNIINQFHALPGVTEVTFVAEDGVLYLKMERSTLDHPDFIRLKEQLQSNGPVVT